jgi:hypothetical protein
MKVLVPTASESLGTQQHRRRHEQTRKVSLATTVVAAATSMVLVFTAAPASAETDELNYRECPSGRTIQVYSNASTQPTASPNFIRHYWVNGGIGRDQTWPQLGASTLKARRSFTGKRLVTYASVYASYIQSATLNCVS